MNADIPPTTVLYDGACRFCIESTGRLKRLLGPGRVQFLDFNAPGVLERFPLVTPEACRSGVQVIDTNGRVSSGAEGIARLLSTRAVLAPLAGLYFIPGLRFLWDQLYALVARHRYRIRGKIAPECASATCGLHEKRRSGGAGVPSTPA